jgi:hypothetical protein
VINVTILDDPTLEGDETFGLFINGAPPGVDLSGITNIAVTILDDEKAIQFSSVNYLVDEGATNAVITLDGPGDLHPFDPWPSVTNRLTFRPGCSLNVRTVTVLPSTRTIATWTDQAESEARILELSTNLYLLAKDYQNLSTFNVDKLTLLKTKLERLVAANPTNLNYKVMLNSVISALEAQPPSATLDELRRAGEDVILTLRSELTREITVAQALVDRFVRWQLAANEALARALGTAAGV